MSYKQITAGVKTAKATGIRFIKAKTGKMGLEVAFTFNEPNVGMERLSWVGWLSEAALQRTLETLHDVLGYNGCEDCENDGVLKDPKALDYSRECLLVVEVEKYNDPETGAEKEAPRIKWVNKLGGSAFEGCSPVTIKTDLQAMGFKAAFLAVKQAAGPSTHSQKQADVMKEPTGWSSQQPGSQPAKPKLNF